MKVNKNIWVGKSKPYNKNSLHFPNVINSGSGGDVPSGGSNIEYLDVSEVRNKQQVVLLSTLIKLEGLILPAAALVEVAIGGIDALRPMINSVNQIAVDGTLEFNAGNGDETIGSAIEGYDSIPRITKEQFYTLE